MESLPVCFILRLDISVFTCTALTLFAYFQEYGDTIAFSCSELDLVLSEVKKVENWKSTCMDKLGTLFQNENLLLHALEKVLI